MQLLLKWLKFYEGKIQKNKSQKYMCYLYEIPKNNSITMSQPFTEEV